MRSSARHLPIALLLWVSLSLIPVEAQAQAEGPSLRSTQEPIRILVDPMYQYYTDDGRVLTQLSTRLAAIVPIGQRFTVQAQARAARAGGDNLEQVRGLTNARVGLTYAQPVGDGSVIASVRSSIPVGTTELSPRGLRTTRLTSQNYYDFRVPSFGQGLSVAPQVTWAVPLTDDLVAGIGVSYRHQRGFRPRQNGRLYTPGDEISANGGIDYRLTRSSAIGVNASVSRYATDQVAGVDRFDAGLRVSGTARYLWRRDFTTLRVVARYANWGESELLPLTSGSRVRVRRRSVIPSHGMGRIRYSTRLSETVRLRTAVGGHLYTETDVSDRQYFGRLRLEPSVTIADVLVLAPHGSVAYGTYLGLGGGMRMEVRL